MASEATAVWLVPEGIFRRRREIEEKKKDREEKKKSNDRKRSQWRFLPLWSRPQVGN